MMIDNNRILEILLEADADPNDPNKQPNEKPAKPAGFEEDPMGFIIRKYDGLRKTLEELMSSDFKQYLTAIFVVSPKPTTFKIILHNGQFFFITYMGKGFYEANVAGKRYYMNNIGTKERAMEAITRLLKFGSPLKTKGPEGAEEATRPEGGGSTGGGGGGTEAGGGESGGEEKAGGGEEGGTEAAGGEEALKESLILRALLTEAVTGGSTEAEKVLEILINLKLKIKNEAALKKFLKEKSKDAKFLNQYFKKYLQGEGDIVKIYFTGIQKVPALSNAKNLGEGNFKTSPEWVAYGGIKSARSKTDVATDKVNYSIKNGETQVRVLDASAPQLKALINYCIDVLNYKKDVRAALEDQIAKLEKIANEESTVMSRLYKGKKYGLGDLRKIADSALKKTISKFDKNTQDLNRVVDEIFQQAQKNAGFKKVFIEESLSGKGMFGKNSEGAADAILTFSLDFSAISTTRIPKAAEKVSKSYSPPKFGTKSSGNRISKTVQQFHKPEPLKELHSLINELNGVLLIEDRLVKNKLLLEDNILQKGIEYIKEKGSNIIKKIVDFFVNFVNKLKELAKTSYEKALNYLGIEIYAEDVNYNASVTYNELH